MMGGAVYAGKYEPLIDRETWEEANRALREGSRPKAKTHRHPYTGLATCTDCGGMLTGDEKKPGLVYYSCRCSRAAGRYYPERTIDGR